MSSEVLDEVLDPARLDALHRTGLLDTAPEEPFDHLTRIAARLLDAPLALVNLIDADRQFSKSCYAPADWPSGTDTPLRDSFCKFVVHTGEAVLIADTHKDPRVRDTRTTREMGVRAYVGIPLTTASGEVLGALCVADFKPREWEAGQVEMLREITELAAGEIAERAARGGPDGLRREREDAREREMQCFLSRASDVLAASSLDYAATIRTLAHLAVPALGDWCVIYVSGGDGALERLEVAHADPARAQEADSLRQFALVQSGDHPVLRALRSGDAVLLAEVTDAALEEAAPEEAHREVVRGLGVRSAMVVPLQARGRSLGALLLVSAESGRRYLPRDLEVAQEFAHRAALAVDNARLFQRSQEANRAKADFLATISHELRTPLNAVTGYADLLRQGIPEPIPARALDYVERIRLSAKHLIQLIEEILSFSHLESGRSTVSRRPVEAAELLAEIRAVIEPLAEGKRLKLIVEEPTAPLTLRTDAAKLRQILLNLLDNAVKFTDQGEIRVSAEAVDDGVRFEVADTGVGIRPEDREAVLEPFRQAEQSATRTAGGTGLGLTVALRLTELLGGRMDFTTTPGEGARFTVELPA